ncbi:MAG: hypothetical protein M1839_001007 [Geoglossum umbratile]|nr:MAG: hypothetical protein M1839_001007 [Geoglossum umbratile]
MAISARPVLEPQRCMQKAAENYGLMACWRERIRSLEGSIKFAALAVWDSSTIVEEVKSHCRSDSTLRVAYFYFDFKIPEALEALYYGSKDGLQPPSKDGLVAALQSILGDSRETYIITDALDECSEREELLELIQDINGWEIGMIHVLVTSRKEWDIEVTLDPLVTCQIHVQSAQIHGDIQLHVHERLHSDPYLKKWPVKVKEEIEEALVGGAHGMFRWVVCQLDALRKCLKVDALRKALKSLPKTLGDTYARILLNIDGEYAQDALKILQWLVFHARPMRIEEVAEVIALDLESDPRFDTERRLPEPRDLLVICSSLVTLSSGTLEYSNCRLEETEELRLAHFSVKEYLISERIRAGPASDFSILEMPAHLSIAQACLAYLLQFDKPDSLTRDTCQKYPLAR